MPIAIAPPTRCHGHEARSRIHDQRSARVQLSIVSQRSRGGVTEHPSHLQLYLHSTAAVVARARLRPWRSGSSMRTTWTCSTPRSGYSGTGSPGTGDVPPRPHAHAFVAIDGGEVVGCAYGYELFRPDGFWMVLYELGVAETYRRQGLGRDLLDEFVAFARAKGHEDVVVHRCRGCRRPSASTRGRAGSDDRLDGLLVGIRVMRPGRPIDLLGNRGLRVRAGRRRFPVQTPTRGPGIGARRFARRAPPRAPHVRPGASRTSSSSPRPASLGDGVWHAAIVAAGLALVCRSASRSRTRPSGGAPTTSRRSSPPPSTTRWRSRGRRRPRASASRSSRTRSGTSSGSCSEPVRAASWSPPADERSAGELRRSA